MVTLAAQEGWMTELRGAASGRCSPTSYTAPDGNFVFVLGADASPSPVPLTDGDYTEVYQDVDLSSVDLLEPSLQTVGVVATPYITPAHIAVLSDTLSLWLMDENVTAAANDVVGFPHLVAEGDLAVADETYSVENSKCRQIPDGSTTARLVAVNTPRLYTASLAEWTLDFALDFRAEEYVAVGGSSGVNPTIFSLTDGTDGFRVFLAGVTGPGANEWNLAVEHDLGGVVVTQIMPLAAWTTNHGWRLVKLVYDSALTGTARIKAYVDGVFVSASLGTMSQLPGAPPSGAPIHVGSPELWGFVDQVRLSDTAHAAGVAASDYTLMTTAASSYATQWRMEISIDGTVYAERVIQASEVRSLADFRVPVRHLSGVHSVALRLTFEVA